MKKQIPISNLQKVVAIVLGVGFGVLTVMTQSHGHVH